jgi:hypothetical protein
MLITVSLRKFKHYKDLIFGFGRCPSGRISLKATGMAAKETLLSRTSSSHPPSFLCSSQESSHRASAR